MFVIFDLKDTSVFTYKAAINIPVNILLGMIWGNVMKIVNENFVH